MQKQSDLTIDRGSAHTLALELYYNSLVAFTRKVFHTVSPGHNYVHGWHIDAICEYLQACENGEIRNLVINIPPRCMKTITVSVAWSAWLLGHNPARQIIAASYSQNLALKDNINVRMVLESDWYRTIFPDVGIVSDQNEKRKFVTTERGHRIATSVGGTLTGEGGDFLLLDDPIKPDEALSDTVRNKTNDWIDSVFMTRRNDPKSGVGVLIMQRLHEEDAAGHLLERGWEHLCLPAEFTKKTIVTMHDKRWEADKGELLIPERLGKQELEQIQIDVGMYAYAAQYLQNPAPLGGGLIKKDWLRYAPEKPMAFNTIVHSWDTASKDGVLNDYSVCTVWGVKTDGYYLLDVICKRMEFPELKRKAQELAERDKPDYILIEDKSSGQALLQDLRQSSTLPLIPIKPQSDKVTRLSAVSVLFETGNVILPEYSHWLDDYVNQLLLFPNAKHDDMVDSTSQFLGWAKERDVKGNVIRQPTHDATTGLPTFNTLANNNPAGGAKRL